MPWRELSSVRPHGTSDLSVRTPTSWNTYINGDIAAINLDWQQFLMAVVGAMTIASQNCHQPGDATTQH